MSDRDGRVEGADHKRPPLSADGKCVGPRHEQAIANPARHDRFDETHLAHSSLNFGFEAARGKRFGNIENAGGRIVLDVWLVGEVWEIECVLCRERVLRV